MDFFAPVYWLMWVFSILGGFDFTDWQDFAPLLTLVVGIIGALMIAGSPHNKASPALVGLMSLLSLWPVVPQMGLFWLAHEFQRVHHGAWPQVMIDDPKNQLGHTSAHYDALFHAVNYLHAFAGAYLLLFFTLFGFLRSRFSRRCQWLFIAICVDCVLIFCFDPGNLYAWWLD